MAGATTTRQSVANFLDAIKDNICILPGDIVDTLLKDRKEESVTLFQTLDRIASSLETGATENKRHNAAMEAKMDEMIRIQNENSEKAEIVAKLDNLTDAVTKTSTALEKQSSVGDTEQLKKNLLQLKDVKGQFLRSQKLAAYTEELLDHDPPYAQRKYRTKVSHGTHEEEIQSYKDETKAKVKSDNERMRMRMRRWEEEIADLNLQIEEALANPNLGRQEKTKFEEQIKKNEEAIVKERDEAFQKIVDEVNKDLNSGETQFLLKFIDENFTDDEENASNPRRGRGSKNSRGPFRGQKNRRGQR